MYWYEYEFIHTSLKPYQFMFIYILIYLYVEHEKSVVLPDGWRLIGFNGGLGGHLHNIGLILIEEDKGEGVRI